MAICLFPFEDPCLKPEAVTSGYVQCVDSRSKNNTIGEMFTVTHTTVQLVEKRERLHEKPFACKNAQKSYRVHFASTMESLYTANSPLSLSR